MPWSSTRPGGREGGVTDLKQFTLDELRAWCAERGEPRYRASQLFRWLYQRRARSFEGMTDLSKSARASLARTAVISWLPTARVEPSADGSRKFLFTLADGRVVESVLIPDAGRLTLCLSSQVGCALACRFCLTGVLGLIRHLDPGEMVNQVLAAQEQLSPGQRLTNLVFMGMGEPLHNYANLVRAVRILTESVGLGFAASRITASTAGLVPELRRFAAELPRVKLAISLSGTTEEQRTALMPINRRYSLRELLQACRELPLPRGRRLTFEYVLLREVNDTPEDAERLVRLLRGIRAKVNLIPMNEHAYAPYACPEEARVLSFQAILRAGRVSTFIRANRGRDVSGACGQLGLSHLQAHPHGAPRAAARIA
ncbi:MAG: 23S rRNA (adenine(2503)-C(2))-methyltransferase RlmN [Deltaproteobacteria bacterium]|nr:23S rRNA (adenine(2503)-C(2))-methyltransferase RlmN [Deltaproteobacteria bacterium]